MRFADITIGQVYVIEGEGPMLLDGKEPEPWLTLRFRPHGHDAPFHWTLPEYVVRECDKALLDRYDAHARPRGMGCQDSLCWCRRVSCET